MNIFKTLAQKPWVPDDDTNVVELRTASYAAANQKVALVCFLAIVSILFFLFFAAYHMRLDPVELAGQASDWVPVPEPPLLWFNTLVLGLASVAFEWARKASNRRDTETAKLAFFSAGAFTLVFLALQLVVWNQLLGLGYYAHANPASAFFYLVTGIHGVHLLGGLVAWGRAARRFVHADQTPAPLARSIDLCALYWHFLLLIWLGILALFVNT